MPRRIKRKSPVLMAADIVRDAGGEVVGRTRLQKIAYFLETSGLGDGFAFEYRHYGPYSEGLADACQLADILGVVDEKEHQASWGGTYSIYRATSGSERKPNSARVELAKLAREADPIELELAATAAFLSVEGSSNPWAETAERKSRKAADGRLERAKALYERLRQVKTPIPLPNIE